MFNTTPKKHKDKFFFFKSFFLIKDASIMPIFLNTFMFMIRRLLGIEIGENIVFDAFMHIWFKCHYINSKV